jgi:hypothetical protein
MANYLKTPAQVYRRKRNQRFFFVFAGKRSPDWMYIEQKTSSG